jgi:SAM-dependent methyltransferase
MKSTFDVKKNGKLLAKLEFHPIDEPDRLINYSPEAGIDQKFYDQFYSSGVNPLRATRLVQFESLWSELECSLPRNQEQKILDVGCGDGAFIDFFESKTNLEAWGVDASLQREHKRLFRGNWLERFPNQVPTNFSVISFLDVFEHFSDPSPALIRANELLSPGGILLLKLPNKCALAYKIGLCLNRIAPKLAVKAWVRLYQLECPPPHYFYHSRASIERLLFSKFDLISGGWISEIPLRGLWSRFWFLPKPMRPLAVIIALIYRILSIRSWNDSIYILARKR